jgi:hypothetical protein
MLILVSCKNNNDRIKFYGETVTVAYPKHAEILKGYNLELDGEYTGWMNAYDGVLMFTSEKFHDGAIHLYDVETGKRISAVCKRGQAPNEVMRFIFSNNFEKDSSGFYLWISDTYNNRLLRINSQGEFTKIISTSNFKSTTPFGIGNIFMLNDSLLIAYSQSESIFEDDDKYSAPSYHVFNYKTGETVSVYKFYSDYTASKDVEILKILPYNYLSSSDGIKPDKNKIAMAMKHLNRINILDLESGKVKSVALKNAPDLNLLSSGKRVETYYKRLQCDDRYIYVIESAYVERTEQNAAFWYENLTNPSGRIFVFDWDGNFTNILQINDDAIGLTDMIGFAFDPVRKILYAKNDAEEITAYDLNYLYK